MTVLWLLLLPLAFAGKLTILENNELKDTCGREMSSLKQAPVYKVLSGYPVKSNEYPFVVAVASRYPKRGHCTGVLISKRHVLTAAHCVVEAMDPMQQLYACRTVGSQGVWKKYHAPEAFIIYAGSRCPAPGPCSPNRTEHLVTRISIHPQHNICYDMNDLAVMELSKDVDENEAISICTPEANTPLPKELKVVGYGFDPNAYNMVEPGLQVASLFEHTELSDEIITTDVNRNACEGDSGGPLFCKSNGRFTLLGVTSVGSAYCSEPREGRTVYYADVRKHLDWLCSVSGVCYSSQKI